MKKCNIVVADDHPIMRDGIKLLIETNENWQVVGEANDGIELLDLLNHVSTDLVVIDLAMPRMQGFEAIREIKKRYPDIKVLVLSGYLFGDNVTAAVSSGACGLVSKAGLGKELLNAIRIVLKGAAYLSPVVRDFDIASAWLPQPPSCPLTDREVELITLISDGYTSVEIAERLNLSVQTVEKYRFDIMQKLNVRNVIELVRFAARSGYVSAG